MLRLLYMVLLLVVSSSAVAAGDLQTYWNTRFGYGIAYPSTWKPAKVGPFFEQDSFSIFNVAEDLNINVMVKQFSPQNRGLYHSITDIPNAKDELSGVIQSENHGSSIQAGTTQLSNEPALWFTYLFVHRSLGNEVWFATYQLSCLKNDVIFTITAKVSGRSQEEVIRKYKEFWPTIVQTISTFTFSS